MLRGPLNHQIQASLQCKREDKKVNNTHTHTHMVSILNSLVVLNTWLFRILNGQIQKNEGNRLSEAMEVREIIKPIIVLQVGCFLSITK